LDKHAVTAVRLLFFIAAAHHLPYNTGALDELLASQAPHRQDIVTVEDLEQVKIYLPLCDHINIIQK
jgi:hypothetical protein